MNIELRKKKLWVKIQKLQKQRKKIENQIKSYYDELHTINEQMRAAISVRVCTPEIANYWRIPKITGDKKTILNACVLDILPPRCPPRVRHRNKNTIALLRNLVFINEIFTVSDIVQLNPAQLMRWRGFGPVTFELLSYCLNWNGLSLEMDVNSNDLDPFLMQTISDLLTPIQSNVSEPILTKLDPNNDVTIKLLLMCSRERLKRVCGVDDTMLDIVAHELAKHGRCFQPDEA